MVRFIMQFAKAALLKEIKFTFHYGQIYYHYIIYVWEITFYIYIPLWLDLLYIETYYKEQEKSYLHSTMVRFIIVYYDNFKTYMLRFTFHYGQIYYSVEDTRRRQSYEIYIPLWLDLLSIQTAQDLLARKNLHSTMVRFIMIMKYGKMV